MIRYLAYGSNMCTPRLTARVPSAEKVAAVSVAGYRLHFEKRGEDGSGKCNIREAAGSKVYGVVFRMYPTGKKELDRVEGPGYRSVRLHIENESCTVEVFTYVAKRKYINESIRPFAWYKLLVVAGAREHDLPQHYIEQLNRVKTVRDPDRERAVKQLSVLQ